MAISNELSSDIAAALIAASDKEPRHLSELKDILIEVHAALQQITEKSRIDRNFYQATMETDSDLLHSRIIGSAPE